MDRYKIVFHIPHDGNCFPKEIMKSLCITKREFLIYHNKMRDTFAKSFVPDYE